jgi:polyhydroxyalkanoate synthesis regulator phasin
VEEKIAKLALRSELVDLRTRVDDLQEQLRALEARLEG